MKFHKGPDTLIILMRLCFVTQQGWESFFLDRDQKVTGPAREFPGRGKTSLRRWWVVNGPEPNVRGLI